MYTDGFRCDLEAENSDNDYELQDQTPGTIDAAPRTIDISEPASSNENAILSPEEHRVAS